jgi:hypothetical protein
MTDTPRHKKYEESVKAYKATLYRSGFAIRSELEPGLRQMIEKSGAPSVSGMLTLFASEPELFAGLLKPHLERLAAEAVAPARRRHKVTMKSVMEELKSTGFTPADVQAVIAEMKSKKAST